MLTPVITHATGDVLPASDWNTYLRDNLNFLIQAGADLTIAANAVTVTNDFHKVTGGGTLNTITHAAPVKGQPHRLLFTSSTTIANGAGNIRCKNQTNRIVAAGEIVEFIYDGTATFYEAEPVTGQRIAYGKKTANVSAGSGATTFATGVDVLAADLSFTADGSLDYLLRVHGPGWHNNGVNATAFLVVKLDGADAGIMAEMQNALANANVPLSTQALIVAPAAGAHTINARLYSTGGGGGATVTMLGDAGGAATPLPITVTLEVA